MSRAPSTASPPVYRLFFAGCFLLAASAAFSQATEKAPVVFETLVFPAQGEHTHGSSLVELPNGDLLSCWFQGSGERTADDVRIMGARLKKGKKTWSQPFLMADSYRLPDCNPVLFLNKQHKLFLVWIVVQAHRWESSILKFRTSIDYNTDGAPVWNWQDNILLAPDDRFAKEVAEKFTQLPPASGASGAYAPPYDNMILEAAQDFAKRSTGWMTRIKPLLLKNGRILLPLYSDGFNLSIVALSDDDGSTWQPSLPIVGRGNVQPALLQKKDGHLFAFMRDNGDAPGRVQFSESADSGLTWSAAQKSGIPNEASVELIALNDGRWAFLGNDEDDGRYRLSLYLSDDEGKTWALKKTLENAARDKGRFSYPCLIQTKDGLLRMTYSYSTSKDTEAIKYVVVDPAALLQPGITKNEILRWEQQGSWARGLERLPHPSVNADSFYVAYHRNPALWNAAFDFLKRTDLDKLAPGKYPILGDAVFAIITEAPSRTREEVKWESHKSYVDLQMVIRGKEEIGIADTAQASITKPYSPDVIYYSAEGKYFIAEPGTFFLFFPNDAHQPTIKVPGYDVVKKIVIKIQTAKAD